MVCSCSRSSTANIWTFFYSLQSKCNQGFFFAPFSFSVKPWHWDYSHCNILLSELRQQIEVQSLATYCFLFQTLAVRNTPRLLYLQCPWNQRGTDITSLAQIATSWEKANIHPICNYSHALAHPFKMCKSFLTAKISLGSPPNVPHFVQSSFEALLKHPNHAVTFDIDVYKSTAQRHQTSIFSDWSASADKLTHCIHNPPICDQEIDQVWLHNFLLHKLSLLLSTFHMR
jgi:hypothetical protein